MDSARLRQALADVISWQPLLRARQLPDERLEITQEQEMAAFNSFVDLEGLPEGAQEAELYRLAGRDAREPFNLAAAPLLRVTVIKRGAQRSVLIFTLHQMIGDRESLALLARQVAAAYAIRLQGLSPGPTPLDKNAFAGFAAGQKQWLSTPAGQRAQQYWEQQLQQVPVLRLPTDFSRPTVKAASLKGARCRRRLSAALARSAYQQAQELGGGESVLLLAIFQVLLARYTGQK